MNLLKGCKISVLNAPISAASNTADFGDTVLDMSGFEGVLLIAPVTDSVATGVATLAAFENTASSSSGATAITGASASATSAVDDDLNDKALVVDVYKPSKRYVLSKLTSATANIAFGNVIAIQYEPGFKPTTQAASVLASALALGA